MKAPSFKPIFNVIRTQKKEEVKINSDIYKEFLKERKKVRTELSDEVKVVIYEHKDVEEIEGEETMEEESGESEGNEIASPKNSKDKKSKLNKGNEKRGSQPNASLKGTPMESIKETKEIDLKKGKKGKEKKDHEKKEKEEENENIKKEEVFSEKKRTDEIVKETKKKKVLGTVKILYNFYVNLYDKLKEDVNNIKNNTCVNKVDLFKDMNLYTNAISMFDIIGICEDLKIIKTFIHSKKECELIWILTLRYFDQIKENVFEKYKNKIDVNVERRAIVMKTEGELVKTKEIPDEKKGKKGGNKSKGNQEDKEITKEIKKEGEQNTEPKANVQKEKVELFETPKEYIYPNCSQRENAIMFRKVNFFIFVYIMIYIIKTCTRKIASIKDDLKKVRSFFFYINLYETKKTIETLTNIYKDKYLSFFQNFTGDKEIEDYRRRKIICHKFAFQHIDKFAIPTEGLESLKNEIIFKNTKPKENEKRVDSLSNELTNDSDVEKEMDEMKNYEEPKKKKVLIDKKENIAEINTDVGKDKKENLLLNQYIFDYIFKNYCYKKNYWKYHPGMYVDFGMITNKDKSKKYKIDMYNHSKYNMQVDVQMNEPLPFTILFKEHLFCVNSKYSVYIQVDATSKGEHYGYLKIRFIYRGIKKEGTLDIPIYAFVQ